MSEASGADCNPYPLNELLKVQSLEKEPRLFTILLRRVVILKNKIGRPIVVV